MTRDKEFDVSTFSVVEYVGDLNKETFDCHNPSINNFLYKESRELNLSNLANTTIVYDNKEKRILGFYTLNAGVIELQEETINLSGIHRVLIVILCLLMEGIKPILLFI